MIPGEPRQLGTLGCATLQVIKRNFAPSVAKCGEKVIYMAQSIHQVLTLITACVVLKVIKSSIQQKQMHVI